MNITRRGPDGKWLGYGSAISAWLPILLDLNKYYALTWLLNTAIKWQTQQARDRIRQAADQVENYEANARCKDNFAIQVADRELAKREVLIKALDQIKRIDEARA